MKKILIFTIIITLCVKSQVFTVHGRGTIIFPALLKQVITGNTTTVSINKLWHRTGKLSVLIEEGRHTTGIDVTDHGAKGDGITDNTKAFQSIFNLLKADMGKGNFKIIIPKGTFLSGHIQTPNSASFFTIQGEGMGVSTLVYTGNKGKDFLTFINPQRIAVKDLTLVSRTGAGKMINILRTENKKGDVGFVSDVLLENLDMPGYLGRFSKGIVFSSSGPNNGQSDQNNEQSTIRNCYAEHADSFGISFEHQNSLWHRIEGGRYSGFVANINNIREDGGSGGGFDSYSTTFMNLTSSVIGIRLTGSQYSINIYNPRSEGGGQLIVTTKSKEGLLLSLNVYGGQWKTGTISKPHFDIGVGTRVMLRDGYFFSSAGVNAKVNGTLMINGGHGNLHKVQNNGFTGIDFYQADAPLIFSGAGITKIGQHNTGNLKK